MRKHTDYSYNQLIKTSLPEVFALVAREHHERRDASGPQGMKGDEIPLLSAAVALFDSAQAMICKLRVYNITDKTDNDPIEKLNERLAPYVSTLYNL